MINFIPQMQPWFDENETAALVKYMESGGWLTEHKKTIEFAGMLADFTGVKYCSILSNGTITMTAALIAMGIGKGAEIIVPDYTMIASATSVILAAATPVFCDVEMETNCMDFESMVSKVNPNTKAIILVSINGRYPKRLDDILQFCKINNIKVIEDAAQSLGSFHKGKHVGTYGDIGSLSFSMPKVITTGQGGALLTDNEDYYKKVELVKNFGRKNAGVDEHIFFGVNFKFTDLQAVIGIEQMKKISVRLSRKKELFSILVNELSSIPGIRFIETSGEVTPWFNDVLVDDPKELMNFLKMHNIGSRPFYPTVHSQAPFYYIESYPNASYFSSHGLWLPSYSQMTQYELDHIIGKIKDYFNK